MFNCSLLWWNWCQLPLLQFVFLQPLPTWVGCAGVSFARWRNGRWICLCGEAVDGADAFVKEVPWRTRGTPSTPVECVGQEKNLAEVAQRIFVPWSKAIRFPESRKSEGTCWYMLHMFKVLSLDTSSCQMGQHRNPSHFGWLSWQERKQVLCISHQCEFRICFYICV